MLEMKHPFKREKWRNPPEVWVATGQKLCTPRLFTLYWKPQKKSLTIPMSKRNFEVHMKHLKILVNWTKWLPTNSHGKLSLALLQTTIFFALRKCKKYCKYINLIRLFWNKNFVHSKLKLLDFLSDLVLTLFHRGRFRLLHKVVA